MTDEFERGQAFGPYVLEARLGGGGFGTVWRARDSGTGRLVALKILAGKFSAGETGRLRADVELLAAAASSGSPHVVRVLGGGPEPVPHVVMEYIEGVSVEAELQSLGTLPQRETLRIVRGVTEALAVLQQAGIIHRDVKPANVMLARGGTVKLTDFGIAKIAGYESVTATGQLPLTGAYAAPEVWGGEATYQSDYYALGAMVFELLTGSRPFNGNFVQLYEMHRNRDPDYALLPGEVVPALRRLIVECLQKEPANRPADGSALLSLVDEAERQLSGTADLVTAETHEPRALGPWLIESVHPTRPWAFRCLHETSGERATVEVHFSDSLELGEQLTRAVAANPHLVPLGAERLLGTNRLILRPGEAWPEQPKSSFMFWIARQELPAPSPQSIQDDATVEAWAASAVALVEAATEKGITVALTEATVHLGSKGTVYVTRVGLPGEPTRPAMDWLKTVLSGAAVLDRVAGDSALATRLAGRQRAREAPALGIAHVPAAGTVSELMEESALVKQSVLAAPPIEARPEPQGAPRSPILTASPPAPSADRRRRIGLWLGGGVAATVIFGGFIVALALRDGGPPFVSVSAGVSHTCGVRTDGTVACWGNNAEGQADAPAGQFRSVSAGYLHTCGVRIDLTVACWGSNADGQADAPSGEFTSVGAAGSRTCDRQGCDGGLHTCGLRQDGTVACWGDNRHGQANAPNGKFATVTVGASHSCGVRTDGSVACWGNNDEGQTDAPAGKFESVSAGGHATCGVRTDRTVDCWGYNDYGHLTPPSGNFASVSVGAFHVCGVATDGAVACWSGNDFGQSVSPPGEFLSVSAGQGHSCGVRPDGAVACWGSNTNGQSSPPRVRSGEFHLAACDAADLGCATRISTSSPTISPGAVTASPTAADTPTPIPTETPTSTATPTVTPTPTAQPAANDLLGVTLSSIRQTSANSFTVSVYFELNGHPDPQDKWRMWIEGAGDCVDAGGKAFGTKWYSDGTLLYADVHRIWPESGWNRSWSFPMTSRSGVITTTLTDMTVDKHNDGTSAILPVRCSTLLAHVDHEGTVTHIYSFNAQTTWVVGVAVQ